MYREVFDHGYSVNSRAKRRNDWDYDNLANNSTSFAGDPFTGTWAYSHAGQDGAVAVASSNGRVVVADARW